MHADTAFSCGSAQDNGTKKNSLIKSGWLPGLHTRAASEEFAARTGPIANFRYLLAHPR